MAEQEQVRPNYLTVEDILDAEDITVIDVKVPEWKTKSGAGGVLSLRTLSAFETSEYVESVEGPAKRRAVVIMMMRSAVRRGPDGPDGKPNILGQLFPNADDQIMIERLAKRSMRAFMRVQKAMLDLNGLTPDKEAQAKNA